MSSEQKPLDPDQRRAASLIAAGLGRNAVAAELKVSPKTIQRLGHREDFQALVRRQREAILPETPTAEGILTQALSAVKKDGSPDWPNRIAAARALLATPVASPEARIEAERVTTIFLAPESNDSAPEDDGSPRPWPIEGVRDAS